MGMQQSNPCLRKRGVVHCLFKDDESSVLRTVSRHYFVAVRVREVHDQAVECHRTFALHVAVFCKKKCIDVFVGVDAVGKSEKNEK